jgi:hypothetical protein
MSYVNDGGCCNGGGWGFPFMGNMGGFGMGMGYEWLLFILFFGMFGWGGNGLGFGGRGLEQATTTAAETASLVGQQQTADRVAGIATGVDAIAGITTANGVKIETVKDAVTNGFYANQRDLCELGNNIAQQFSAQTMNNMQNHNNLTSQLTEMRFANQQCCCDTKQLIQSSFCDLRHQMQVDKCDTMQAIAASKAEILGAWQAARMAELEAKNLELKGQISQSNQTAQLAALIQQQRGCAPCGPYSPCSPCGNPCLDGLQRAVTDAFGNRISEILFPPTTTTAAA